MAGEASQVSRGAAVSPTAGCSLPSVRCADAIETVQPGERWTLWVKDTNVARATVGDVNYCKLKGVDPGCDVYDLTARWLRDMNLDVHPSRVTLRLVPRGPCDDPDDPTEAQEQAATALRPRHTLRGAGVVDGSSLLAAFVSTGNVGALRAAPLLLPARLHAYRRALGSAFRV